MEAANRSRTRAAGSGPASGKTWTTAIRQRDYMGLQGFSHSSGLLGRDSYMFMMCSYIISSLSDAFGRTYLYLLKS